MNSPEIPDTSPAILTLQAGTYWWCSCGKSKSQPFCDGSHKGSGFAPLKYELSEERTLAICQCKHSKRPPLCDGSHARLT